MQGISLKDLGLMFVPENFRLYFAGFMVFLILFGLCLLWSLIRSGKDAVPRFFAVYTIFLLLTIYNPIAVKIVFSHFNFDAQYYRFIWLLPVSIVLAYYATRLTALLKNGPLRCLAVVVIALLILVLGNPNLDLSRLKMPDNLYKVPDAVLDVSAVIHEDSNNEPVNAAMYYELNMVMRQYDPAMGLSFNRDDMLCFLDIPDQAGRKTSESYLRAEPLMSFLMRSQMLEVDELKQSLKDNEVDYLVYVSAAPLADRLTEAGCTFVREVDGYAIFRTNI